MEARDGDSFMTPFQCDKCVFQNIQFRDPNPRLAQDRLLRSCALRVILDAFWARESRTVKSNGAALRRALKIGEELGMNPIFKDPGPMPLEDNWGYGVAITMVKASLEKGKYGDYTQFDTIRSYRSVYSNYFRTTASGCGAVLTLGDEDGKRKHFTRCATNSEWFARFSLGCKKRMGQDVRQNLALGPKVVRGILELLVEEIEGAMEAPRVRELVTIGAFIATCYCGSFRGSEPFMLDLLALRKWIERGVDGEEGSASFVIVPLLGRFKGEQKERQHLLPVASKTRSGIEPRKWLEALIQVRAAEGRTDGPAICDEEGYVMEFGDVDSEFKRLARELQERRPDLIKPEVDVDTEISIFRSLRRGAESEAKARGVSNSDQDVMNRWRNWEQARGRDPARPMRDRYADVVLLLAAHLRYTLEL